jgi:hypothetical protein
VDVEFVKSSFSGIDCVEVGWTKSSYCADCNCVEVSAPGGEGGDGLVLVRDTKDRSKPAHEFTREEWVAFIKGVKAGEFDLKEG